MALVLAAQVGSFIVLGADSLVNCFNPTTGQWSRANDEKLFERPGVGIVTFGQGPAGPPSVPQIIRQDLPRSPRLEEVVTFMVRRFAACKGMGCLIGGLDDNQYPWLYQVSSGNAVPLASTMGKPPQLWRRGKLNDSVDLAVPDDSNKAIEQMIETLRNATDNEEVGPQFEFLSLAPGQPNERQSFTAN
jgi:hypothetical protein